MMVGFDRSVFRTEPIHTDAVTICAIGGRRRCRDVAHKTAKQEDTFYPRHL